MGIGRCPRKLCWRDPWPRGLFAPEHQTTSPAGQNALPSTGLCSFCLGSRTGNKNTAPGQSPAPLYKGGCLLWWRLKALFAEPAPTTETNVQVKEHTVKVSKDLIWVFRKVGCFNKYAAHIAKARGANGLGQQRPRGGRENNFNKEEIAASRSSGGKKRREWELCRAVRFSAEGGSPCPEGATIGPLLKRMGSCQTPPSALARGCLDCSS